MAGEEGFEQLVHTARKAGAALRDADVDAVDVRDRPVAVEDEDARGPERVRHLVAAPEVVVVVAEHRVDGSPESVARLGEHPRLLGVAVGRHVAGKEDQVGLAVDLREGGLDPLSVRLVGMDVAGGGDADSSRACVHARHGGSD